MFALFVCFAVSYAKIMQNLERLVQSSAATEANGESHKFWFEIFSFLNKTAHSHFDGIVS
jgi:hypothetical protein